MLSFSEFIEESLDEALSASGRYLKQRNLVKNRWKLKRRAKISQGITGSAKRMTRRAHQAARRAVYKKLLGVSPTGKSKLTSTQKLAAERIIKRLGPAYIKNLSPRIRQVQSRLAQRKRLTKQYGNVKKKR